MVHFLITEDARQWINRVQKYFRTWAGLGTNELNRSSWSEM
jgi:hypothetical protein